MAELPERSPQLRAEITARAAQVGWAPLHAELALIDPRAAAKIHATIRTGFSAHWSVPAHRQAHLGKWQAATPAPAGGVHWLRFALIPRIGPRTSRHWSSVWPRNARCRPAGRGHGRLYGRGDSARGLLLRASDPPALGNTVPGRATLAEATRQALVATGQLASAKAELAAGESVLVSIASGASAGKGLIGRPSASVIA